MYIYRDMGFFIMALILYDALLYKGVIYLHEAMILLALILVYGLVIAQMNKYYTNNNGTERKLQ